MSRTDKTEKELYRTLSGRKVTTLTFRMAGDVIEVPIKLDERTGEFSCVVASGIIKSESLQELKVEAQLRSTAALDQSWTPVVFISSVSRGVDITYAFRSSKPIAHKVKLTWREAQRVKARKEPHPVVLEHLYIQGRREKVDPAEVNGVPFTITRRVHRGEVATPMRRDQVYGVSKSTVCEVELTAAVSWAIQRWYDAEDEQERKQKALRQQADEAAASFLEHVKVSGDIVHAVNTVLSRPAAEDAELPPEGGAGGPGQDVCCSCGTDLTNASLVYGAGTGAGTGRDGFFNCRACHEGGA